MDLVPLDVGKARQLDKAIGSMFITPEIVFLSLSLWKVESLYGLFI